MRRDIYSIRLGQVALPAGSGLAARRESAGVVYLLTVVVILRVMGIVGL
jgi:hypothetical protein